MTRNPFLSRIFGRRSRHHDQSVIQLSRSIEWPFAALSACLKAVEKAEFAMRTRQYDVAESLLQFAASKVPHDRGVLVGLANVAQAQSRWSDAQARWEAVIEVQSDLAHAHSNRALAVMMQGDSKRASNLYKEIMFIFPEDLGPPIALTRLLLKIPEADREPYVDAAERGLKDRLSRHPNHVGLTVAFAQLAVVRGDLKIAYKRFNIAHALAINDHEITRELNELAAALNIKREL